MEFMKTGRIAKKNVTENDFKIISFLKENFNISLDIQTLWIIKQLLKRNKTSKRKPKKTLKNLFHNFQAQETTFTRTEETKIHKKGKVIHKHLIKETEEINSKDATYEKDMNITCEQLQPKDLNRKGKTRKKENKD